MAVRSSSPSLTATGSPRSRGADLLRDCARRGMRAPCWPSATARWGSGMRCARCSPRPGSSGAGSTRPRMCWPRCRSLRTRGRRRPWRRSGAPRISRTPARRSRRSRPLTARSSPRPPRRSPTTLDELLAFYDYPCEHWVHLRTTNPIESTFATVRHRTKVTKGPGSRAAGPGDGVQAHRGSARPLARGQRTPPRRSGPRRGDLHQRQTHRTTRRERRAGSRLKNPDPQVLTIAPLRLGSQRVMSVRPSRDPHAR